MKKLYCITTKESTVVGLADIKNNEASFSYAVETYFNGSVIPRNYFTMDITKCKVNKVEESYNSSDRVLFEN